MGLITGNRSLQGSPTFPYPNVKSYAGQDLFLDVAFVDHTNTAVVPTSIQFEMDDITNAIDMEGPITLASGGSTTAPLYYGAFAATMTIQIAGSLMQMSYPYQGSQICQLKFLFTAVDTVTGQSFSGIAIVIDELGAAPTVSGSF